jgi:pyrroloquinoline quinone (PQQ) biosynthesis protein C
METAMSTSILRFVGLLFAGALLAYPADLDTSYQALKDALPNQDVAEIKKLAAETCGLARAAISSTAPTDEAEKDAWTKHVAFARDVEVFSEYALFSTALTVAEPATTIDLITTLEAQNPKSHYLDGAYGAYFVALTKTGAAAKITTVAEAAIKNFPENEDLLLVLADMHMNRKQVQAAGADSERLIAVLSKHSKPETMSAADWERKKVAALTHAYYYAGMAHAEKNEYALCNQDLRAALPLVKGNQAMLAATLFYLGLSNYNMGRQGMDRARILEAAKFSEEAAAIASPFQQTAWTNAHLMKAEATKMVARGK